MTSENVEFIDNIPLEATATGAQFIDGYLYISLTMTCILDCRWAYGSRGTILDLRNPSRPRLAGTWPHDDIGGAGHSISEVAPGRILVDAGRGPLLLDARRSPMSPKVIADSDTTPQSNNSHSIDWPGGMRSPYLLAGRGSFTSCALVSYDVSEWISKGKIFEKSSYQARGQDTIPDGTPASFDCPHWFDAQPGYRDGGVVVSPWHSKGVRFVKVTPKGILERAGYFYAPNGRSWTTLWGRAGYVYSIDYHRGLDILKFHGV